jgi:hypothetical protein
MDNLPSLISKFLSEAGAAPELSVSGWVPHADEGAILRFHQTADSVPPLDLQGTAIMFFAMEEMGQVPTAEFAFQIQDPTNVLVSLREQEKGKLIGVLLFVGPKADQLSTDLCIALTQKTKVAFQGEASPPPTLEVAPQSNSEREKELKQILTESALECCAIRLETYIPGIAARRENLEQPNAQSRTVTSGGTQTLVVSSGQHASVTLNLVFLEGNLKDLVSQSLKLPIEKTTEDVIRDFFREFLNQTQGALQKRLQFQSIRHKNGIPLSITAEDAVPSFLSSLTYEAGAAFHLDRSRFEIRVAIKITQETALGSLTAIPVRDTLRDESADIDIEALLDAI